VKQHEESIEQVSEYHYEIMQYINDVHEADDFSDAYEFNERYIEIERMIMNKEID
jgi:hypothetical protein